MSLLYDNGINSVQFSDIVGLPYEKSISYFNCSAADFELDEEQLKRLSRATHTDVKTLKNIFPHK